MKLGNPLLILMALAALLIIPMDTMYTSRFVPRFKVLETKRIITSNQLATAKIVSENLNHVKELVFQNIDFPGQKDSVGAETVLFEFLTECVGDLKMRLVSVHSSPPTISERVTTFGYDIQLEGDYFSFGEFCSKLENSRRVLVMTSFEVSQNTSSANSNGTGTAATESSRPAGQKSVSIQLHLDTFRLKQGV